MCVAGDPRRNRAIQATGPNGARRSGPPLQQQCRSAQSRAPPGGLGDAVVGHARARARLVAAPRPPPQQKQGLFPRRRAFSAAARAAIACQGHDPRRLAGEQGGSRSLEAIFAVCPLTHNRARERGATTHPPHRRRAAPPRADTRDRWRRGRTTRRERARSRRRASTARAQR